jgi:hypothetical protein
MYSRFFGVPVERQLKSLLQKVQVRHDVMIHEIETGNKKKKTDEVTQERVVETPFGYFL